MMKRKKEHLEATQVEMLKIGIVLGLHYPNKAKQILDEAKSLGTIARLAELNPDSKITDARGILLRRALN